MSGSTATEIDSFTKNLKKIDGKVLKFISNIVMDIPFKITWSIFIFS